MEESKSSNTMTLVIVLVVLVILAAAVFLLLRNQNPTTTSNTTDSTNTITNNPVSGAANDSTSGKVPGIVNINITGISFPAVTTIKRGQTIVWTNNDSMAHTVTFTAGTDSGNLNPGQTFERFFDTVGTFDYSCIYHPTMKGQIIVTE